MKKTKSIFNKLSKINKPTLIFVGLFISIVLIIGIPTLARYKNRFINTVTVWDGSVASNYQNGNGTVNDPYIISNGQQLAYFSEELLTTDYENKYFELGNDIILNEGSFNYASNNIEYYLDNETYYIDPYTNKYYDNVSLSGTEIGTVNIFPSFSTFKGYFNGNSYRINGIYVTNQSSVKLALFNDLQGSVHDLYFENTLVYGGSVTAGVAATTKNATLTNVYLDGDVIGKSDVTNQSIVDSLSNASASVTTEINDTSLNLTNNIPFHGANVISSSITGDYSLSGVTEQDSTIKINNVNLNGGSFNLSLGSSPLTSVPMSTITTTGSGNVNFTNLKYHVVYDYGVAGGIIAKSINTTITNIVSLANVSGTTVAGGLVGVIADETNLNQTYNKGEINGTYAGGLVGIIEKNNNATLINKSYNTGQLTGTTKGGIASSIVDNNAGINITKSFSTLTDDYSINNINNSNVTITDSYHISSTNSINNGNATGNFTSTNLTNLKTKSFMITNLELMEFEDYNDLETNPENTWVYEAAALPILFIDDIAKPIASININLRSWNNLSHELSTINISNNVNFNIEELDIENPVQNIYYYIHNFSTPLTKQEVLDITAWQTYSGVTEISGEGPHVVYAKIVDNEDNIYYLNSDVIDINYPGIKLDNHKWSSLRQSLDNVYINQNKTATLESIENFTTIKYYLTDQILDTTDLNNLNANDWTDYTSGILIDQLGTHIIYVKLVDGLGTVKYLNSDYLVFGGYITTDLTIGHNASSYIGVDPFISNRSNLTLSFTYTNTQNDLTDITHNLVSNILLPAGTKLTLHDDINYKFYTYQTTSANYGYDNSCSTTGCGKFATYPFSLFKEVGNTTLPYIEDSYYDNGVIDERFKINIDFSATSINTNYNDVALYLELRNNSGAVIRPTLNNTIEAFNVYSIVNESDTYANLYLNTDYTGVPISFDTNSTTSININSGFNYQTVNSNQITDTIFENQEQGLVIKLVDDNDQPVARDYLKNFIFKIGDEVYSPDDEGLIRINLNNGISNTSKVLDIITFTNNSDLAVGNYTFKINNFVSTDGNYYESLGTDEINIPLAVTNKKIKDNHNFEVLMNDEHRILNKSISVVNNEFNIIWSGSFTEPVLKVSLFKKDSLTAYNQDYSLVNLQDYTSDFLISSGVNTYVVSSSPISYNPVTRLTNDFNVNLLTNQFENTGYKLEYYLYDGLQKVSTIEKYFIVK